MYIYTLLSIRQHKIFLNYLSWLLGVQQFKVKLRFEKTFGITYFVTWSVTIRLKIRFKNIFKN